MSDKDAIVRDLIGEWAEIDGLLDGLEPERWEAPTPCPGWTVRDVVAHVIGTELSLTGAGQPEGTGDVHALPHVRNDIGAFNEQWVRHFRTRTPDQVLARFREVTTERAKALAAMSQEEFDAPSWTPEGNATYARFMQIRIFDCWMHEQDIRDALGLPGGMDGAAAARSLDEIGPKLGYIVGKRAGAPDGTTVTVELTGPHARTWHIEVAGRAHLVDHLDGPATATLILPTPAFTRLYGGRITPHEASGITLQGDQALAQKIIGSLAITI